MSDTYLIPDDEQLRYDQEDELLMQVLHESNMKRRAAEQEKLDIEIKCEIAKYHAHLKKVRHLYHNAARVTATLAGACGVATGFYLINSDALGVLITSMCVVGLVNLTTFFDKKSRRKKKEERHGL